MADANTTPKLTRDEVTAIVGPLDDYRIAQIIETGATATELTEAFEWLSQDEYTGEAKRQPLGGRVAELFEILTADAPGDND